MQMKDYHYQVLAADEGRIDALVARLIEFSRSRVRGLIDHGGVTIDGMPCGDAGYAVKKDQNITIRYDPQCRYREKPAERTTHGFTVVYVDDYLVVVNKHAGILTVPTDHGEGNSLIDLVSTHLNRGQTRGKKVGLVHRLDRDTSGLLIFGRNPDITKALIQQFSDRKPEREYRAIVAGRVEETRDTIRSYLATDKTLNQKSVSEAQGELAITHFRVLERYKDTTLVEVQLETGRRNQIRVHFAEKGHPVLGDTRYSPEKASHPAWPYKRLALHARSLGFQHPKDGRRIVLEAAIPHEFERFLKR